MAKVYDVRGNDFYICLIDRKRSDFWKGYLGSVGVTTPVSTVHTWVEVRDNPTLCGADFVGANAQ